MCARCKRSLRRPPILVDGKGYGSTCATKVGDLLTPERPRGDPKPRRRRVNERQLDLLGAE